LLNLDIRDLTFWFKEAQKELVKRQLKAIQASRLAMANNDEFQRANSELERQLMELNIGKKDIIQENWKDLRILGKRK